MNPYLGGDSLEPFLKHEDKGVIILCRTSNPGARDMQDLRRSSGRKLYHAIAELAAQKWNSRGNCMLVVGATYPRELAEIREIVGDMPFLVPGVGAQGGDVAQPCRTAARERHRPRHQLSRAILYASSGTTSPAAARTARSLARSDQPARSRVMTPRDSDPLRSSCARCALCRLLAQLRTRRSAQRRRLPTDLLRGNGPEPDSLDPQSARSVEAHTILRDLCEGLTTLAKDASAAPASRGMDRQRRRQDLHFKLRPEARWSNGDRVVAADFVAGLRRLVDPATASQYAQIIDVIVNAGDIIAGKKQPDSLGVTAPDDARSSFSSPHPRRICPACSRIRARARCIAPRSPRRRADSEPGVMVSNGAFVLKSGSRAARARRAQSHYWNDARPNSTP